MKSGLRITDGEFRKATAVVGLLVSAAVTLAQVPLRDYYGEEVRWHSARALALGGVAVAENGPAAVFANPGLLGFAPASGVELSYGLSVASEQRMRVVYDQFENTLGEVTIADNIHAHGIPGPLSAVWKRGRIGVAGGLAPVRDFAYTYHKEYRDDFYAKIGDERVEQTGALCAGTLGAGFRPIDILSLGVAGNYYFGSRELETVTISGLDTARQSESGSPAGLGFGGGLVVRPLARLSASIGYQTGPDLGGWRAKDSLVDEQSRAYPAVARFGVSYRATGVLPSIASVEATYQNWADTDTLMSNVLSVRAGVEHTMLSFVRLRYGFGIEPQPFDPAIQVAAIGFGLGFDAGVAQIDVGALLTHDIIGPDHFSTRLTQTDLKVQESRDYFAVTLSRGF